MTATPKPCAAANSAIALWLQSWPLAGRVNELESLQAVKTFRFLLLLLGVLSRPALAAPPDLLVKWTPLPRNINAATDVPRREGGSHGTRQKAYARSLPTFWSLAH